MNEKLDELVKTLREDMARAHQQSLIFIYTPTATECNGMIRAYRGTIKKINELFETKYDDKIPIE